MQETLVVLLIFAGSAAVAIAFSPIGKAIAERIRRDRGQDPILLGDVDDLRVRLAEVEERLDFAERALVAGPDARAIADAQDKRTTHNVPS